MKKLWMLLAAGVLVVALSVYAIVLHDQKTRLKNQLAAFYDKSFEELMTDLNSLQAKLGKLEAASGTGQLTMLLMDVWRQAGDTESAIAALPVSYQKTSSLTQFMNRTGDYCRSISKKLAMGEEMSQNDQKQLRSLYNSCEDISGRLTEIWHEGYPGEAGFAQDVFMAEAGGDELEGGLDFSNQEYPRLQYDGPFSESVEDKQPEGLAGGEVTREEAQKAAALFVGVEAETLRDESDLMGDIPCYGFAGEAASVAFSIYVSRQGGHVLWYMSHRDVGISAVPTDKKYEQLAKVAQEFAGQKGYGQTEPSYAQFYGGMAVINLAPVENDVVLYPDLVKVWVDIAAAEVAGLDANNYLMSHKSRDLPAPEISEAQAKEKITSGMAVENTRMALIPLETGEEKLCYEFTGKVEERDFIIYINAQTGTEEDILMIQHTNEGTLVM